MFTVPEMLSPNRSVWAHASALTASSLRTASSNSECRSRSASLNSVLLGLKRHALNHGIAVEREAQVLKDLSAASDRLYT